MSDVIEIYACFCTGDEDGLTLECSWRWSGGGENGEVEGPETDEGGHDGQDYKT